MKIDGASLRAPRRDFGLHVQFEDGLKATSAWAASLTQTPDLRTEKQLRGFARFLRLVSDSRLGRQEFQIR